MMGRTLLCLICACGDDSVPLSDSGPSRDAARGDGGSGDAAVFDAAGLDAASVDAAADAGTGDAGPAPPDRIVFVYTPHGSFGADFRPSATGEDFELPPILEPFAPYRSRVTVVSGLDLALPIDLPPDTCTPAAPYAYGPSTLLTGWPGTGTTEVPLGCYALFRAGGPSVDHAIAEIGVPTAFRTIVLGARTRVSADLASVWRISWSGADAPIPSDDDPREAFERLFSDFEPSTPEIEALGARVAMPLDASANDSFPEVVDRQLEIIHAAITYDLSRAFTLQLSKPAPNETYTWLGHSQSHHELSHGSPGSAEEDQFRAILRWQAERVASLAARLDATPAGAGTLLDHTLIVWMSDVGMRNVVAAHDYHDIPVVMIGNVSGRLRAGQHVVHEGNHVDLLLTLLRIMGSDAIGFGDPRYAAVPIDELIAL